MQACELLKEKIESFETSDFDFQLYDFCGKKDIYISILLREVVICYNQIYSLSDKEQKKDLIKLLDTILIRKFKDLNSQFTDSIVETMISYCKRGIYQCLIDIFVISDCVFSKEGTFNDFGSLYKIETFMFNDYKSYANVFKHLYFCYDDNIYTYPKIKGDSLTKEEEMFISKFISDNINMTLFDEFKCNVSKPTYELNTSNSFYDYDGLVENEMWGVNIFLNKKFKDIGKDILKKRECDIRMVVQNGDDISIYNFHQSFDTDKPIWAPQKLNEPIWKLSDEVLKKENDLSSKKRQLKRTHTLF